MENQRQYFALLAQNSSINSRKQTKLGRTHNELVSVYVWHLHDQVGEGEPLARKQGPSEQQSSLDLPRET